MAYGSLKITADEIYEALTVCNHSTGYVRRLNDDGDRLAELITERVLDRLTKLLAQREPQ